MSRSVSTPSPSCITYAPCEAQIRVAGARSASRSDCRLVLGVAPGRFGSRLRSPCGGYGGEVSDEPRSGTGTIIPDTKDWTWVVELRCPECDFDAGSVRPQDVAERLRQELPLWRDVLTGDDPGQRPEPTIWSPLEYACHVRDVLVLYDRRLHLMLDEEDPQFDNWDQDETAVDQDYGSQQPGVVLDEIEAAGDTLVSSLLDVGDDQWERPGRRSDGAVFTLDTFVRYMLHDIVHHGWDVRGDGETTD